MPFENLNEPSFFYYSSKHKEALARMVYAVQHRKLGVLLTGEYGTGKTFLSRVLKRTLGTGSHAFILISNPRLSPLEFIDEANYQLGAKADPAHPASKTELLRSIQRKLEDYHEKNIYVVMLVDDAQSILEEDLLEEIRLLLNIQREEELLFTLILSGQPQLASKVERIPQLKQRLAIRYKLRALNQEETKEYIEHRLKIAGSTRKIFDQPAYDKIFSLSRGMPRAINNICDLALLSAFIKKVPGIGEEIIADVGEELGESASTDQIVPAPEERKSQ